LTPRRDFYTIRSPPGATPVATLLLVRV
jgi:hypothetical protein